MTSASKTLFTKPQWLCFSDVRNFLKDEPLLDWLNHYEGKHAHGRRKASGSAQRDFKTFIMKQGVDFEDWVVYSHIKPLFEVHQFSDLSKYNRAQQKQHKAATEEAFANSEVLVLYQPLLVDPKDKWYGHPDLVVHSSALDKITEKLAELMNVEHVPFSSENEESERWVVIDTKFSSSLANRPLYQAQLLLYANMINTSQPKAEDHTTWEDLYLLGRTGQLASAFSSATQVSKVKELLSSARKWMEQLHSEDSKAWKATPVPTVPELRANAKRTESSEWDDVVDKIALEQGDPTMVYKVGIVARNKLPSPVLPWFHKDCSASYLFGPKYNADVSNIVNKMLKQARLIREGKSDQCEWPELNWEAIGASDHGALATSREFLFVDFEFVYDLHLLNQFKPANTPAASWVFSIATILSNGDHPENSFASVVNSETGELTDESELQLWSRWFDWMQEIQSAEAKTLYLVHWSAAEVNCFSRLRRKVHDRDMDDLKVKLQNDLDWFDRCCRWVDLMSVLIKTKSVVPGCLDFALKPCYQALPEGENDKDKIEKLVSDVSHGDQASTVCYELARQKKLSSPPDLLMAQTMEYNVADVLMLRALWKKMVRL